MQFAGAHAVRLLAVIVALAATVVPGVDPLRCEWSAHLPHATSAPQTLSSADVDSGSAHQCELCANPGARAPSLEVRGAETLAWNVPDPSSPSLAEHPSALLIPPRA
jgi:hypothetical protein